MRALSTLLLAGLLAATPTAEAKDMAGRFGVGADSSLGFVTASGLDPALFPDAPGGVVKLPGLSVVYRASKLFGVQLIFNTQLTSGETNVLGTDVPQSITQVGVALRGHIGVGLSKNANLDAVIGVTYVGTDHNIDGNDVYSATQIPIELGIRPEWFVTEHLSFHTQVGITFSILNEENVLFSESGVHVNIFGAADLLGNAGFTFYF